MAKSKPASAPSAPDALALDVAFPRYLHNAALELCYVEDADAYAAALRSGWTVAPQPQILTKDGESCSVATPAEKQHALRAGWVE